MSAPTKELLKNRQVVGYELCKNPFCNWKNVFFEGEEHRPELIAALGIFGDYLCPRCRNEEYHAARFQFASSIGSYAEVFPDEFVNDNKVKEELSTPPDIRSMTLRQHVRAVVRFFFPWAEEGQATVFASTVIFGFVILWELAFADFQAVSAFFTIYLWIVGLVTAYHCVLLLVGLTTLIGKKETRQQARWNLLNFWKEMGEDPLFPIYTRRRRERQYSYKYFRSEGMSRKKARHLSGRRY